MQPLEPGTLGMLWHDADAREERLRSIIMDRLADDQPPVVPDHVVATYFFALRSLSLTDAAEEIRYHATSGIRNPPPGSLLEACSARTAGVDAFDATGRLGLLHVAFPLKMLRHPDGHVTSCDLLHTAAGAIVFDVYENQDARLVRLGIPDDVLRTFPGPAHGPSGVRALTGFAPDEPAFGTILKPTAGITPDKVGALVAEAAACPLFLFVKEDENLYPDLDYSPVRERVRQAVEAIHRAQDRRGGRGILFAPHVSGSPHEIMDAVGAALEAGATALMFSESFSGGTVRMVREATRQLERPPAIYGHNAGIGVKTRAIWREVIDMLARLDGIDFRQTAPVKPGTPFLKPYGREWDASEAALSQPLGDAKPTMIARAGALDQGSIGLNLADAEARGLQEGILFLAGSAINAIKGHGGNPDPRIGTEAMQQALDCHRSGELRGVAADDHLQALYALSERRNLRELQQALRQRYPHAF